MKIRSDPKLPQSFHDDCESFAFPFLKLQILDDSL